MFANTLALVPNLSLLLLFCVTQAVAGVSLLLLFSGPTVGLISWARNLFLLSVEAILRADVCKCVAEPICRPDEHDRKERLFFFFFN